MRIKQADLAGFIEETILSIRTGMQAAQAAGIVFDGMPKELNISVEIIDSVQSLNSVTGVAATNGDAAATDTDTTVRTGTQDTTNTDAAATDTDATVRTATQSTGESGNDTDRTTNTWGEYTDT